MREPAKDVRCEGRPLLRSEREPLFEKKSVCVARQLSSFPYNMIDI